MKTIHLSWKKQGLIFQPQYQNSVIQSHAALPFLDFSSDNNSTLYFSARDGQGRSYLCCSPISIAAEQSTFSDSSNTKVILTPGKLGTFDDSGCTNSWLVRIDSDTQFLYYTGWSLGKTVPFYFGIGLAISKDNGKTFHRYSDGPVIGQSADEPYLAASPCVIRENGLWRMWYVSGSKWEEGANQPKHYYRIRYAESHNGVNWSLRHYCFEFADENEYAIAKPSVLKYADGYIMWYCYRGSDYKIGVAFSTDGLTWQRKDELAGITPGNFSWEQDSIAYPHVTETADKKLVMLYNGDNFGKTGIGLALAS